MAPCVARAWEARESGGCRADVACLQSALLTNRPRLDFTVYVMCSKFKTKPLGGFETRSNEVQFTVLKRSLWLLLCGKRIKKGRKSGTERRERMHHISGRSAARLLRPVGTGLRVLLGAALKPQSLTSR